MVVDDSSLTASKARLQQLRQGYRSQLNSISSDLPTITPSTSPKRSASPQRAASPSSQQQRRSAADVRKKKEADDWEAEISRQAKLRAETQAQVKHMAREGQVTVHIADRTATLTPTRNSPS